MLTFEEWRHTYADAFETDDAARAAWTAANNRGYRAGIQDTRALLAASAPTLGEQHSDDVAVDAFASAMKAKMADARANGRSGWQCMSASDLSRMLREHVEKGDPRDVANFCMMLWMNCVPIAPAVAQPLSVERDAFESWWNAKLAAGEAPIDVAFHMFTELTADDALLGAKGE